MRLAASVLFGTLMMVSAASAQHLSADGATQTFSFIADQYFSDVYFHFAPTAGTAAGLHQYDTQLEDYSAANIQQQIAALHDYEKKISAIDPTALDASIASELSGEDRRRARVSLPRPPRVRRLGRIRGALDIRSRKSPALRGASAGSC